MIVEGFEVPEAALQAGRKAMTPPFKVCDIETAMRPLIEAELPQGARGRTVVIAMRTADRLIQRERRTGAIRFDQNTRAWLDATS